MEQLLTGGFYNPLNSTVTEYNYLVGGDSWNATQLQVIQLVSTDGVIKQLRVKLNGSPGAGKKYTFTLMLNGNPTALTFDIADAATTGGDMVNEVTITGGDYLSLRCVPTNSPTARYAAWDAIFEGDNERESLIMSGSHETVSKTAIEYSQVMTCKSFFSVAESDFRQVCPTDGMIKDLYVALDIDPGTPPDDAYRFTLRKNGISQALTVTINADNKTGNDLVHTVNVVAGDILTLMIEPLNTPFMAPNPIWGMTFVADVDGESIIMGGGYPGPDTSSARYNYTTGRNSSAWTSESFRYQLGQVCVLKKLHILLSAAPGAGKHWDFNLRIAGAASNVVATIADAATTGNSGALQDDVALDEYLTLESAPTSVPAATYVYWGFVCYIAPPPPPPLPPPPPAKIGTMSVGIPARYRYNQYNVTLEGAFSTDEQLHSFRELFAKARTKTVLHDIPGSRPIGEDMTEELRNTQYIQFAYEDRPITGWYLLRDFNMFQDETPEGADMGSYIFTISVFFLGTKAFYQAGYRALGMESLESDWSI